MEMRIIPQKLTLSNLMQDGEDMISSSQHYETHPQTALLEEIHLPSHLCILIKPLNGDEESYMVLQAPRCILMKIQKI